jgi:hypothetical protein
MPLWVERASMDDGWAKLLAKWGELLDEYQKLTALERDVAYWHSEPTLTALLATSAWQTGGAGLVEFETERTRHFGAESGAGRGDAWLKVGQRWYAIEAKLCWMAEEIKVGLEAATADLTRMRKEDRADEALAVCYCVTELLTAPTQDFIRALTTKTARMLPDAVLIAGYVPSDGLAPGHGQRSFPGLITAARKWQQPAAADL